MQIFVINLRSAQARRNTVSEALSRQGLDYRIFDAIDGGGDVLDHFAGIDRALYRLNTCREPLPGEIGCYASHLALWKTCVELDEPVVILEDDCDPQPNFRAALQSVEKLIDRLGFVRLESHERKTRKPSISANRKLGVVDQFDLIYVSDVPLCLLGYAISPTAAVKLVESSAVLTAPVDKFVQRTWEHSTPVFALAPACVGRSIHSRETTIGNRPAKSRNPWLLVKRSLFKGLGEFRRRQFDRRQLRSMGGTGESLPARERVPLAGPDRGSPLHQ